MNWFKDPLELDAELNVLIWSEKTLSRFFERFNDGREYNANSYEYVERKLIDTRKRIAVIKKKLSKYPLPIQGIK